MGVPIALGYKEDDASGAQVIDGSLRFDRSKTQYLKRTPSSAGNQKTWTFSCWVKRSANLSQIQTIISASNSGSGSPLSSLFLFGEALDFYADANDTGTRRTTTAKVRDISGWYHLVFVQDTTQSSNRLKLYINGIEQKAWDTDNPPAQNTSIGLCGNLPHYIGTYSYSVGTNHIDAYLSQVYLIDGQALDPSYFGYTDPLTNTWRPKKYKPTGTPNNGTTWSSSFTGSFLSGYPATNSFDGNLSTETYADRPGTVTFTPSTPLQGTPGVWLMYNGSTATFSVNGTNVSSTLRSYIDARGGPQAGVIFYEFSNLTQLSSLSFTGVSGGDYWRIAAITINGVILLDGVNDPGGVGRNGFYLPFDGNSPIGQDQSGKGNNWTPVNFGGSNTIEKATGALPILNTDGGGKVARVGVRTDSNASSLVLALPLVGIKSDFSNAINSGTSNKTITVSGSAAGITTISNFYGGSFNFGTATASAVYPSATSSDFAFGTGDFTVEFWFYSTATSRKYLGDFRSNGAGGDSGSGGPFIIWADNGSDSTGTRIRYANDAGTPNFDLLGGLGLPPINTWHHLAIVRRSNTVSGYLNGVLTNSTTDSTNYSTNTSFSFGNALNNTSNFSGYLQDLRIYKGLAKYTQNFIPASTDPDILPDTPSGVAYSSNVALVPSTDGAVALDGSGDYLSLADNADLDLGSSNFTIEGFVYVNSTSGSQQTFVAKGTGANNQASYHIALNTSGNWVYYLSSNGSTWDIVSAAVIGAYTPNAWQHIALVRSGNTFTPYLNGVAGTPTTSSATLFDSNKIFSIGADDPGSQLLFGFTSNVHVVKGTALYTSNFTPPTGPISSVANTKLLCCKSNSSATTFDVSPGTITANGNAVASNFNPFTVNINTQRGQESGYATLNPLKVKTTNTYTFSNGNLDIAASTVADQAAHGTLAVSSGKYYFEITYNTQGTSPAYAGFGVAKASNTSLDAYTDNVIYRQDGGIYKYNSGTIDATVASFTVGDVIGIALNADAPSVAFYKNGVLLHTVTLTADSYVPCTSANAGANRSWSASSNFGQKPFKFPPPAGFQPLALANTPRPTIVRPDQYVGIVTYSGNGTGSGQTKFVNTSFKADLIWIKDRDASNHHVLQDSVRGFSSTKLLSPNNTTAENTSNDPTDGAQRGYISESLYNGFTVVDGNNSTYSQINKNGTRYVAWAWKAGGNSNTFNINDIGYSTASAAGLTAGTITPTGASVNTKSGFSIIGYTGTGNGSDTVPHGLGKAPSLIFVKSRNGTVQWVTYHSSLGKDYYDPGLNTTNAANSASNYWGSGGVTSTVFGLQNQPGGGSGNNSLSPMIAYCWAEIPGFSKFGSYTGNNSTDGPVVITGFRPRWVLIKCSSSDQSGNAHWLLIDGERNKFNVSSNIILGNVSDREYTAADGVVGIDILSNGFKLRDTNTSRNASATYIYAAFAETPSFNLYGGQSNAR